MTDGQYFCPLSGGASTGRSRFRLLSRPQLIEETAFLQSIEVASIDEILWFNFFCTCIDFRGLVDDRLKRFGFEFQPRL